METPLRKGTRWLVVQQYSDDNYDEGEIVSQHTTYKLASSAARNNSRVRIMSVEDYLDSVREYPDFLE